MGHLSDQDIREAHFTDRPAVRIPHRQKKLAESPRDRVLTEIGAMLERESGRYAAASEEAARVKEYDKAARLYIQGQTAATLCLKVRSMRRRV